MKKIPLSVLAYVFLQYIIFLIVIFATSEEAKMVKMSDLRSWEDCFYFFWLFGMPLLIDFVILGLPVGLSFRKIATLKNRIPIYFLFLISFAVEFIFAESLYGTQSAMIKVGICIVLFLLLFWKRLKKGNAKPQSSRQI